MSVGTAEAKLQQPLNGRARHGARVRRVAQPEQRRSARDDARHRQRLLVADRKPVLKYGPRGTERIERQEVVPDEDDEGCQQVASPGELRGKLSLI